MKPILFPLYSPPSLTQMLMEHTPFDTGRMLLRAFPDGESYIRIDTDVKDREVTFLATLDRPNEKSIPLFLAAETARALGAKKVHLITPYLAYMRQDTQFHPGEGITSNYYAALLSHYFDSLLTVDPHLHRHHAMNEIYSIPATVLHATQAISDWIKQHLSDPLLIGPDGESEQWVAEVAEGAHAPYVISQKVRTGDREVSTTFPNMEAYPHHTPVLVDDIISTAVTMITAVNHLKKLNMKTPICVGIHAVFADHAYAHLQETGATIVTCNTIEHPSNAINLGTVIANSLYPKV